MVCCYSLSAIPCYLLFAVRHRLSSTAHLFSSGPTTVCSNERNRKYLEKNTLIMIRKRGREQRGEICTVRMMRLVTLFL